MIMKHVRNLLEEQFSEILKSLYSEEIFQTELINSLELFDDKQQLFYYDKDNQIKAVLSIKQDGNSNFTNFWVASDEYLIEIANQLLNTNNKIYLLAGKTEQVEKIFKLLGIDKRIKKDRFYTFNKLKSELSTSELRKAEINELDIKIIQRFLPEFFEIEDEELIQKVNEREKVIGKIEKGVYFLDVNNKTVAIGRISSESKNYAELTTIFVDSQQRGKGYGKKLLLGLIEECLKKGKIPVLQVNSLNNSAIHLYESVGFDYLTEYSFEFADLSGK